MAMGFGIAALIVTMIAFGVPVYAIVVTWLGMVLASIGALAGDRIFATAAPVLAAVNTFMFSPLTVAHFRHSEMGTFLFVATLALLAAPIVSIFLHASGKVVLGNQKEGS